MIRSLTFKMYALFSVSVVMAFATAWSLNDLYHHHVATTKYQKSIIDLQRDTNALQGLLWLYLEYRDDKSFQNLAAQQVRITQGLEHSQLPASKVKKVKSLISQLAELMAQDKRFQALAKQIYFEERYLVQRSSLLNTRYNMFIQNIHEHLASQQKSELLQANKRIEDTMIELIFLCSLFSVAISTVSYCLLRSFKAGSTALSHGILHIQSRNFAHRIECNALASEFSSLGCAFNTMSKELEQNVVTKSALETEVNRQTLELQRQKMELEYLSEHDSLTGAMNRRSLETGLETAISKSKRTGLFIAVLFIDLDKFKEINDIYGHHVGDLVLVAVTERLRENTRSSDLVSRYGGDEFVVCLDLLNDKEAAKNKAMQLIDAIQQSIFINGAKHHVGASIGISCFPDHGCTHAELIHAADKAMYVAKTLGQSSFVVADVPNLASKSIKKTVCIKGEAVLDHRTSN
ncbi:diguanylate cyclase [Vibrio sp. Isolate34]|uniref:diguanylate cyclase n=1 Tax=Vibrio sp. Isolate34 TaxID=2908540 RepID=UPI001EFE129C|nr:diguanylate cyclase [Vibrio sp. Isolate34]MCG9639591.1 diguanylate cyclase [Vibrio sp. Isolate34]